jgi:hypothetical protein
MHRLTKLFFTLALVMSVNVLSAGLIDFTGDVIGVGGDGGAIVSASDDGTTVDFFVSVSGVTTPTAAFGAVEGDPKTAFVNNDEGSDSIDGGGNGEFVTDEPTGQSISRDYLFRISGLTILDFGLDLLDFGDSCCSADGGTATLQAFSDANWSVPIGAADVYTIAGPFVDGNVQSLFVNPGLAIGSVRLSFSTGALTPGQDTGTGIDNVTWTTIPEPGTVALFGTGLLALGAIARKRQTRKK